MWPLGNNKSKTITALTNQTIGGQSLIYRTFREVLSCEEASIRLLEITYFSATVTTSAFLMLGKDNDKEEILDGFSRRVIEKSIPSSQEAISSNVAISEYQRRYQEYYSLLEGIFIPQPSTPSNPTITLLLHLFECVTGSGGKGQMLKLAGAAPIINNYVNDHLDFIKQIK